MENGSIIGTTTIADRWRISLIKDVREVLEEQGHDVQEGDGIVYRLEDDRIVIEPSKKGKGQ